MTDRSATQKADTGPLPALPVAGRTPRRRWLGLLVGLGLGLITLVVVWMMLWPSHDDRPLEVVQSFAGALEARDVSRLLSFVEPTAARREIFPELQSYAEHLREIRFDEARYTLLTNDGTNATVHWTATMHYSVDLGSEVRSASTPIDLQVRLVHIERAWYIRSFSRAAPR